MITQRSDRQASDRGVWLERMALCVLFPTLAACGEPNELSLGDTASLENLAALYPAASELLSQPPMGLPESTSEGIRIVSLPKQIDRGPSWHSIARPFHLTLLEDEPGVFVLETEGRPGEVRVRRQDVGDSQARIVDHAIQLDSVAANGEAFFFATPGGVEELIVAREPSEPIRYELGLPPEWHLRVGHSPQPIVELLDAGDVPRMRMVADRAWDTEGRTIEPMLSVDGSQITLSLPEGIEGPVLIDPEWQETGRPSVVRSGVASALLPDGAVLIVGGSTNFASRTPTELAERFDPTTGVFQPAGSMTSKRLSPTATMLRNGQLLISGGVATAGPNNELAPATATAELYDPVTGTFTATDSMTEGRTLHSATRLQDGTVLIAGGTTGASGYFDDLPVTATAELYDPQSGTFALVGELAEARGWHGAVLLPNGQVLIVGGIGEPAPMQFPFGAPTEAELYDPATEQFSPAGSMLVGRLNPLAVLLPEQGAVLIATGLTAAGGFPSYVSASELYDLGTGTFSPTGEVLKPRYGSAVSLLPEGSVLVAGGMGETNTGTGVSTEVYTPDEGTFATASELPEAQVGPTLTWLPEGRLLAFDGLSAALYSPPVAIPVEPEVEPMDHARFGHTATLLPTGNVLVVGGADEPYAEIYEPATQQFRTLPASDSLVRRYHTATRLPGGKVLLAGGQTGDEQSAALASALLFDPTDETIAPAANLSGPRGGHTATLLPDGRVLVVGGRSAGGTGDVLETAEVYDAKDNSWTLGPPLSGPRHWHDAALLPDGRVLIVGGTAHDKHDPSDWLATAEVFDPAAGPSGSFVTVVPFQLFPGAAAEVMTDGKVLILSENSNPEVFDPVTDTFEMLPSFGGRYAPRTALLPSGKIIIAGGENLFGDDPELAQSSVDVFDPVSGSMEAAGQMSVRRAYHTETLLADGSVLLLGGSFGATFPQVTASADRWRDVPAPIQGWRPTITSTLDRLAPHTEITIEGTGFEGVAEASGGKYPSPTNHPVVVWMPLAGAPSHGLVLEFTDTSIRWRVPASSYAGPGQLFVIVNGVPSLGVSLTLNQVDTGLRCPASGACQSGFCRDEVCCDSDCSGGCEACSAALKSWGDDGECGPTATDTDPRGACESEPLSSCGLTGFCDGAGQCQHYPEGTPCGQGTACIEGTCRHGLCDGDHSVTTGSGVEDCTPYRCSTAEDSCLTGCVTNSDCIDGHTCGPEGRCELLGETVSGCGPACTVGSGRRSEGLAWLWLTLGAATGMVRRRCRLSKGLHARCSSH
ncbi:MAG: hypothetical protein DRI90_01520 [Deltaproteobacteria bacterium]|nr:MAG: hypothetical protein DRI90_01520 [Deltaproteobacteria bacterium]